MTGPPRTSVVVPLFNEEQNVPLLVEAVRHAMAGGTSWELVLVDDGSTDGTVEGIRQACADDARVRSVIMARNYGQSTAMQAGFDHARGPIIVTMDGDLQNDPRDIPRVVRRLERGGFDLVAGYRVRRQDRLLTRKVPSWVANRIIRALTGVSIRDNGCSLKAYRRELLERMRLYSDMHRFIPALAVGTAGARIGEIPVRHHSRRHGESKYGLSRVGKVLTDLITIKLIRSFRSRPLRFAGAAGAGAFLAGLLFAIATALDAAELGGGGDVVFIGGALLSTGLGVFLLFVGLVAESAVRQQTMAGARTRPLAREVAL